MKKITGLDCIVLVDDDKITNFINKKIIKRADLDVDIKVNYNGLEAINYLKKLSNSSIKGNSPRPGIIFLDINMPGMSGWDFIDEYKKLPVKQKEKIMIAMLTTSINPDDEEVANTTPEINIYLRKPLTVKKLEKTIETYFSTV